MLAGLKSLSVLLLVLSLGLHWAALQTVAWAGMIVAYAKEGTVREAISKTFDGEHPCPLCKAIEQGREHEKQQDQKTLKPSGKLDPGILCQALHLDFRARFEPPSPAGAHSPARSDSPPKPRPRSSLV
ncbi:MAG: hypothetical protein HS113_24500 [Verrucomicrobiales bacterium]|nr:hypothetical protein [Verrucomicrobiales bacterium]